MPSVIEKYFQFFSNKKKSSKTDLHTFISKVKKETESLSLKGKRKLELEKIKLDLKKQYYKLGVYISNKITSENIYDFSYDDKFKEIIDEINSLQSYIKNLSQKEN